MKQFHTLYKRAKTGKIQYWQVEVISLMNDLGHYVIQKKSGQLGTENPIVHNETVKEGKRKLTVREQAEFQAESDWKKKKDEGYKSTVDLGLKAIDMTQYQNKQQPLYHVPGDSPQSGYPLELALEKVLSQFNTDASGNVKPMLAKAVDWRKVQYPCIVQPKLDGVRCLMIVSFNTGADQSVIFLSRSGKKYNTLAHIIPSVTNYCFTKGKNPVEFILDGEIYSHEITFQQITAAVKKENEHTPLLKFRVYDMVNSEDQLSRLREVEQLVKSINSDYITLVECFKAESQDVIKNAHDTWVQQGYEGAMIRHLNGKYGQGQRSSDLLKVKEFDETEYTIVDFKLGQREEDLIAVCIDTVGGDFNVKMMGTAGYKKEMWEWWHTPMAERKKNKFSNPQLTVKHFGRTDDGLPRFPVGKAIRDYE